MTECTLKTDGMNHEITCKGHATGSPEVCAGISALVYALEGFLENYCDDFHVKHEPGDVEIWYAYRDDDIFHMFLIGLLEIEKGYPDHIRVTAPDLW